MRTAPGYRRDHLRALGQRIEIDAKEVRIMGLKSELLRTLVAASGAKTAGFGVPILHRSGSPGPDRQPLIKSRT
jgi:site-specific DNA recombinase